MKLALGTVQFGMNYGAFNKQGQVGVDAVRDILDFAHKSGIEMLDTAQAYGESEAVLGELGAPRSFEIVTKCPSLEGQENPKELLNWHFEESLAHLRTERVHGYLLHRADDLLGEDGDEIWNALCALQAHNKVTNIGVSAYTPDKVLALLSRFPLSLVQLPANALTSWLYDGDFLDICKKEGVELHVRSAFLQGFLLADPSALTGHLANWVTVLTKFRERAADLGLSPLQAALAALLSQPAIDRVLVGVDSKSQLQEIVEATGYPNIEPGAFRNVSSRDLGLVDPRNWTS